MRPIVKWAGGKTQLLENIQEKMPSKFNGYYEPFLGGGAVLFRLAPKKAVVNDINTELMNLYQQIKNDALSFLMIVDELDGVFCDEKYYYKLRQRYNKKIKDCEYDCELAALFVWLNKHCFNGLYRVNQDGFFNVPYNNKNGFRKSVDRDNVYAVSDYLQNITLLNEDFEECLKTVSEQDFVFIDSPYAPIKPTSFDSYTREGFDETNHRRLAQVFKRLTDEGCYCMLTNHDVPLIRELYKNYNIDKINVSRFINRDVYGRIGTELIIRNY